MTLTPIARSSKSARLWPYLPKGDQKGDQKGGPRKGIQKGSQKQTKRGIGHHVTSIARKAGQKGDKKQNQSLGYWLRIANWLDNGGPIYIYREKGAKRGTKSKIGGLLYIG